MKHLVSEKKSDLSKGDKIVINWRGDGDKAVVTYVGADYIKFKLDMDKSPNEDTGAIYFDDFKQYKVKKI